jgi:hypothetical protein
MRLDLAQLEPKERDRIGPRLLGMLARSRWCRPRDWPKAVVVHTPERREVCARLALAEEFRRNALPDAAHEVVARQIGPGEILLWLVVDREEEAGVAIVVVQLIDGSRCAR